MAWVLYHTAFALRHSQRNNDMGKKGLQNLLEKAEMFDGSTVLNEKLKTIVSASTKCFETTTN